MEPLAKGSLSLRLYPHLDRPADEVVGELRAQAALAAGHGFDGVMTSEHHNGFYGYIPNPLQIAGWLLEAMPRGWAAACPLLLPLRPATIVAEETAWLAARFPGRVGLGVAAGGLPADFELVDMPMDDLGKRFTAGLERVASLLRGEDMTNDPAFAACITSPVPLVSAVNSDTSVRRAARVGAGIIIDSLTSPARCKEIVDGYRAAGGTGAAILIRRAWVGEAPRGEFDKQMDVYRSYAASSAMKQWGEDELVNIASAADVAATLLDALHTTGADALNIRVTVPGVAPEAVREQITVIGDEVLPIVRAELRGNDG